MTVSKGGYLSVQFGQKRPFEVGHVIEVLEGASVERVDVALPRGCAISGRISDESGDPIAGALVRVMRYQYVDGQRSLVPLRDGVVPPDEYFVVALQYLETGQEHDPEQLEKWRDDATKVVVTDNRTTTVTLTIRQ